MTRTSVNIQNPSMNPLSEAAVEPSLPNVLPTQLKEITGVHHFSTNLNVSLIMTLLTRDVVATYRSNRYQLEGSELISQDGKSYCDWIMSISRDNFFKRFHRKKLQFFEQQ